MSGKFNKAGSDYNKDATFSKFSIDETVKVTLSEAIAKDTDDKQITVYGWVEFPLVGVEQYGDKMWVYEPQLCKFSIPKRDYENDYNGKKTPIVQSPGMRAAVHLITEYGFDKPFSALLDFSMAEAVAQSIITRKSPDGKDVNPAELEMIGKFFMRLEPLEKLDKLEGKEIKEQSRGSGGYGGAKGQKESEKLADRLVFLKAQMMPDSELGMICASLEGEEGSAFQSFAVKELIRSLFN